jgi:hypothetical protein
MLPHHVRQAVQTVASVQMEQKRQTMFGTVHLVYHYHHTTRPVQRLPYEEVLQEGSCLQVAEQKGDMLH